MFPYDATLLATIEEEPLSISDVIATMRTIDATCVMGDGLKWFNSLYLQVTEAVAERIAEGAFSDGQWLALLDVQFAKLYFSALKTWLSGGFPPECWQVLFARRDATPVARIQFALAGVNAHINHDLAEAIVSTCVASATQPDRGSVHYADYTALNPTLDSLIETAKKELHVRLLGEALPPFSRLEDTLAAFSVSASRESAWQGSEHLWAVRSIPALSAGFEDMVDGFTAVIGKTLLTPVP